MRTDDWTVLFGCIICSHVHFKRSWCQWDFLNKWNFTNWLHCVFSSRSPSRSPSFSTLIPNSMIYLSSASWVSASTETILIHTEATAALFLCHPPIYPSLQTWCSSWATCQWRRMPPNQTAWTTSYWSVLFHAVHQLDLIYIALCASVSVHVSAWWTSIDLDGIERRVSLFCSVREGKGAAERWNLLPGHQANHQQPYQVSVCHLS